MLNILAMIDESANRSPTISPIEGFGERLKSAREAAGKTQKKLGSELSKTDAAVSQWERGENLPDVEACFLLPDLINVTFMWLFYNRGERQPLKVTDMDIAKRPLIDKIIRRLPTDKIALLDQLVESMSPPEQEAPDANPQARGRTS